MAKKSQPRTDAAAPADSGSGVDPALAAFASFVRSEEKRERDAKKAAREARAKEQEANRLIENKDRAAAKLKSLRSRSGVSPQEREQAEADYRAALAAVVAAETGEAPSWAPEVVEPEAVEAESAEVGDADADSSNDQADEAAPEAS